jgi:signal transduction histidine kinase
MHLGHPPVPNLPIPVIIEGNGQPLGINSELCALTLYQFEVEAHCPGQAILYRLEQFPQLPGVVIRQQGQWIGVISRGQILEQLIHPHGYGQMAADTVAQLHRYFKVQPLVLPLNTSILNAAQQALRRPHEAQNEPIVVQLEDGYALLNAHDLNLAHWHIRGIETQVRLERLQMKMLQSYKMADLGRLVDGVAHEILDPVSFIWGNLSHIDTYTQQMLGLLEAYENEFPEVSGALEIMRQEMEIGYVREDLPKALQSARGGANRLRKLAMSLQNFCHLDEVYPKPANLHSLLDSILLLLQSRLQTHIEIVRDYGNLPPIPCFAGQLGQVFMNILTNMIDSLLEQVIHSSLAQERNDSLGLSVASVGPPKITLQTYVRSRPSSLSTSNDQVRWVSIVLKDNGPGLPPDLEAELCQSFSASTRILKETSLTMSYHIVTAKHGGDLQVRSQRFLHPEHQTLGGSEFEILLPMTLGDG